MGVEIRQAVMPDAALLAADLRAADRLEILAATGLAPLPAIEESIRVSSQVWSGLVDGEMVAIFGLRRPSLLSDRAYPWLLGTNAVARHPRPFLRLSKAAVADWRTRFRLLENYVDARNAAAIRWLAWLGFTIHPARPYGAQGLPFHRFTMEGDR
ncbi:MAG: hypothetical protein Kilf2KO_44500 [Rhodospirillales bacterium]